MKTALILVIAAFLISCGSKNSEKEKSDQPTAVRDTTAGSKDSARAQFAEVYIMGSDAGHYFQTLYKLNRFDEMLAMTSKRSIDKYGQDVILQFYRSRLDFGFELGNLTAVEKHDDGSKTLIYIAQITATKVKRCIDIINENDSIKILLPGKSLDSFLKPGE